MWPATPRTCSDPCSRSRSTPEPRRSRPCATAGRWRRWSSPPSCPQQIQSLITQGVGNPTVQLYLNGKDPIERQFVDQAISSRINQVEQDVSKQVLRVAITDLQQVLNGGSVQILGQTVRLLGLRNARTIVQGTLASLPADSPLRPALNQVISFADLAIQGLGFAKPVLGTHRDAADRQRDPTRRAHDADRRLRRGDRGGRVADVRDDAAGGGHARPRAHGERLPAPRPRPGDPRQTAVGEGGSLRGLRHRGHAVDGRVRVVVRAP